MYARIHGCWLHFTGIITSWRVNFLSSGAAPGGWDSFHSRLSLGIGWMLCVVGSLETMCRSCPTMIPRTWGLYVHPFWSSVIGSVGAGNAYLSAPSFT